MYSRQRESTSSIFPNFALISYFPFKRYEAFFIHKVLGILVCLFLLHFSATSIFVIHIKHFLKNFQYQLNPAFTWEIWKMFQINYSPGSVSYFFCPFLLFIIAILFLIKCNFETPVLPETLFGIPFAYPKGMKEFEIKDFALNISMKIILVKPEAAVKRCSVK